MPTPAKPRRNVPPQPPPRTMEQVRERRRTKRIGTLTHGRVNDVNVQVLDVSLDGVGFCSAVPFELHAKHPIVIGNGPMYLEARIEVVSVRAKRNGTWVIGAVFC